MFSYALTCAIFERGLAGHASWVPCTHASARSIPAFQKGTEKVRLCVGLAALDAPLSRTAVIVYICICE